MKTTTIIAFLLLGLTASAATNIRTQHFELRDSLRLFETEDVDDLGFKHTQSIMCDWPVTVNGKPCEALTKFLCDSLFHVQDHRDIFPYYPSDVNVLSDFLGDVTSRQMNQHPMFSEFTVKSGWTKPDIDPQEEPMRYWYDNMTFKLSHTQGNLAFFTASYDSYYGGAHGMYFTTYYIFDTRLNKPIHLRDVITNPKALLRLLPKYDRRGREGTWWENTSVEQIDNFYIKDGKMTFVFPPYAIGPFSDGEVKVSVPLKKLKAKGLLTTYGKRLIK